MSIELKINTKRGKKYLLITERYWDKEAPTLCAKIVDVRTFRMTNKSGGER
jgi:hypothetical protein